MAGGCTRGGARGAALPRESIASLSAPTARAATQQELAPKGAVLVVSVLHCSEEHSPTRNRQGRSSAASIYHC